MAEDKIIRKIQLLKAIEPRKDWVVYTKERIFEGRTPTEMSIREKERFATTFTTLVKSVFRPLVVAPALLVLAIGAFFLVQGSLPGEPLHSIERLAEQGQGGLIGSDKAEFHLGIAEKRVKELQKIIENNEVEKLAPAIEEYQDNLRKAADSLAQEKKEPEQTLKIAEKVDRIAQETEIVEKALGITIIGKDNLKNQTVASLKTSLEEAETRMSELVGREIANLERGSLTPEQEELLEQSKEYYEAGDYNQALEIILIIPHK